MQLRRVLLAASFLAVPFSAMAQPVTGLSIAGGAGPNVLQNQTAALRNAPGAPVPAAAPAAAPAPRSYLVFFGEDTASLTSRARQIIQAAADNAGRLHTTRIEVNGYTDTSGTPQVNMGLSLRRAQAVAAELVSDGMPRNAITIEGFGQTHLLVPTGPGVREPQNRRVDIILH